MSRMAGISEEPPARENLVDVEGLDRSFKERGIERGLDPHEVRRDPRLEVGAGDFGRNRDLVG